jgi:hypothetical protein
MPEREMTQDLCLLIPIRIITVKGIARGAVYTAEPADNQVIMLIMTTRNKPINPNLTSLLMVFG